MAKAKGGGKKPRLGTGKRFKQLVSKIKRRKGGKKIADPKALAAAIGRKALGKTRFQKLAAKGRKRAAAKRKSK